MRLLRTTALLVFALVASGLHNIDHHPGPMRCEDRLNSRSREGYTRQVRCSGLDEGSTRVLR